MYDKDKLREHFRRLIEPWIIRCDQIGLKPTHITLIGFLFTTIACFAYYKEATVAAFTAMLIARLCDAIDGTFARITDQVTLFGGFLDSLIDRYGEFLVVGTILFVYRENMTLYYFSFAVFLGISLMSYSRALYDKYGVKCPGNPFEYFERGILLGVFFIMGRLDVWLIVTAIGTNVCVLHRIYYFREVVGEKASV